ncbi:RhoGAP-domain-containing protein, partial [Coniochaeta ligniaria NRRL 30616]
TQKTYYDSDSSGAETPEPPSPGCVLAEASTLGVELGIADQNNRPALSPRFTHDARSVSDSVVSQTPRGGTSSKPRPTMAGPSAASHADAAKNAPRKSSIDSAVSAISSKSIPNRSSPDGSPGAIPDVASLIKTAGSAEAVIQYLLKEKQSQSQQNSQLWRLVDKQRAMILGLNKDLERALKDKEKYRKKLKEVMAMADIPPIPAVPSVQLSEPAKEARTVSGAEPKEQVVEVPDSPSMDSDSQRPSPIDVSMAPYPITPPADQPRRDAPPSRVGELLDPAHAMPKPSEHALDQFDHEKQDRDAENARVHADESNDLLINLSLPPSRSLPGPPRGPPPSLPSAPPPSGPLPDVTPKVDEGIVQFPAPPAPPPRKLPPAPLQLRNAKQSPIVPPEEDYETDSDYDDVLEVDEITNEIPTNDRRGRRRTREDDDREREVLARKEAEMRSLSKKSKGSSKGTPKIVEHEAAAPKEALPSPGLPTPRKGGMQRDNVPASLAGILNGDTEEDLRAPVVPPALLSPGLPSSPRPMGMKSPMNSPPLSPLGVASFGGTALSPRPPRQPIPLPPNTPLHTPPNVEPLNLKSPKPLNIVKKADEASEPSPTKYSSHSSDSPMTVERTRIFKGFVTEDFPDLLLPPNALPSVDIRVASSRMKPSRASLVSLTQLEEDPVFTLAIFSRADGGELWRVEKDSISLAKLDHRLKQCPAFTARTPDRSLFSGHAPAKLDARRIALDQYLDELLNTPLDLATALELCKYLSTNTLPPNADETGSSPADPTIEGSQKVGPGGRPYKNGYLTKRGKNFGGWKARYFVLDGPLLKYYETPGGAHLGTIKLQRAQIGKQSGHNEGQSPARAPTGNEDIDNQYRHAFLILEPKKKDPNSVTKHVLCAESDRERDQWVETLLRWIDYRDPNDEEPAKKDHTHDRHVSATQAAHAKRRTQGAKQAPLQPTESEDTLIGVSYEATKPGDVPEGVPSKSKSSGGHEQDSQHGKTMSSQPGFSISAPTDLQVITDSQPWGSKLGMALAPPNQEEKKARKRSFFGFGPKTRTSSDGQDSLFGSDSASISSQQTGSQPSGPVRQVFGASLGEAVRYNSPVDVKVPLPAVVYRCIQYLEARNAILEEGIFRLSGSNVVIKALRERFNNESDINLLEDEQYYDIHAVASLLKLYLRELPTTILTRDLHLEFLSVTEMPVQSEKIAALSELVLRLPQANATLLKYLIAFLIKIINHQDSNKMTVRNVGIVFSPTLNIPAPVFAMFLQNYEGIFGIDPTEYELPTPIDQERRPSIPSERSSDRPSFQQDRQQERRPSDPNPPRPSTSGSSPHRPRLMESLMEKPGSRNTPTPPLVNLQHMAQMNAAQRSSPAQQRSSPTPPPQRSYEPQFLAQQNAVDNRVSTRPAYESGFVLPQGYDVTQYQPPPSRGNAATYDRPSFEAPGGGLAPYEQSYGSSGPKSNRRESAIFMSGPGGVRSETSRSRLREEAQF